MDMHFYQYYCLQDFQFQEDLMKKQNKNSLSKRKENQNNNRKPFNKKITELNKKQLEYFCRIKFLVSKAKKKKQLKQNKRNNRNKNSKKQVIQKVKKQNKSSNKKKKTDYHQFKFVYQYSQEQSQSFQDDYFIYNLQSFAAFQIDFVILQVYKIVKFQIMKKKLDLNNLLAKYENAGNTHNNYYDSRKEMPIEEEFYNNSKTYQHQTISPPRYNEMVQHQQTTSTTNNVFKGNFQMSKNECEQFLLQIRNQLKAEQDGLNSYSQTSLRQIEMRFQKNHQRIRKQILDLLDKAFYQNERAIKEELLKHSKYQPTQFNPVYESIQQINHQIEGYLTLLKSNDYRKAISEVVLKDYSYQITKLRDDIRSAKSLYIESLGQVEPDRARIQCIKEDLNKLFYFKKKTAKLVQKSLFQALGRNMNINNNNNNNNMTQSKEQQQAASRTRKSFFNFGNN